ncbi:MAG: SPASM domain-containing protein, partial [Victivallales bacterium]|nr:SPASM domain-containing protein [Victivallales bacterium]
RKTVLEIWAFNCFSKYFYIGSNLEVYPCVMERRFSHGNLAGKKLSEIVDQSLLNFSKEQVKGCRDCEYRFACLDCRPDSLSGDKYEKSWFCLYDEQNGVWRDSDERIKELLGTDAAAQ